MSNKRDFRRPVVPIDDGGHENGTIHGVRGGNKRPIRRPTEPPEKRVGRGLFERFLDLLDEGPVLRLPDLDGPVVGLRG